MDRDYDELLADILIHIDQIEKNVQKVSKRMDLTIKRVVKVETRLDKLENGLNELNKKAEYMSETQGKVNESVNARLIELFKKIK